MREPKTAYSKVWAGRAPAGTKIAKEYFLAFNLLKSG